MTQNMAELSRQIDTAERLESVIKTMKILASVSIRQYQEAVESLKEYNRTTELGLQILLRDRRGMAALDVTPGEHFIAVIFGSDQGLVGQFNTRIADFALARIKALQPHHQDNTLLALGARLASSLSGAGQTLGAALEMPNSQAGIDPTVREILLHIQDWRAQREINRIVLFFNDPRGGATYESVMVDLLPLNPNLLRHLANKSWDSRSLPFYTLDWDALFSAIIRQYFFVSLYRALAGSLASENASRLASMENAERNIEDHLKNLGNQYRHQRQNAITSELFDVVTGFEALSGES